ncbi:DUF4131 domain-containing protein, partial [Psychroserpens mesophilus]|uniref:DUF4131 domain-containing protein n=1 Tax=Psychroserpens mesophilus TaxID=325473 RepID=UPI003D654E6D
PTHAKWEPAPTLLAYGNPEAVPPAPNPHQFDFAAYLRTRGIHGRFRPDAGSRVLPANPRGAGSLGRTVARLRHRLIESLGAA